MNTIKEYPFDTLVQLVLDSYHLGVFPMAQSRTSADIFWVSPEMRGVIPLDQVHMPKKLMKEIRQHHFEVTYDQDFEEVITQCALRARTKDDSWINPLIKDIYCALYEKMHAHSVEIWSMEGELIGGLYGVSLGSAFFGESMFSLHPNTSKIALYYLIEYLKKMDFTLLDTQFINEHLKQFGAIEIPRQEYLILLEKALEKKRLPERWSE